LYHFSIIQARKNTGGDQRAGKYPTTSGVRSMIYVLSCSKDGPVINIGVWWLPWQDDVRTFLEDCPDEIEIPAYAVPASSTL
jgi:hypothetical protein